MGKKLAALLLAGCLLLAAAGCGAKDVLEDVGTEIKADGRAHGQTTSPFGRGDREDRVL